MAACMSWEGEKGREMAEVCWRSYFLSVGVILPLTAVLSAAWMEVDPVSWVGGVGGRGKRKKKKYECTALEELQVLMTMRKIHQNQDAPYLFTNLQLLCDGLIADSWLCGEDKAFRGRTGLICSAEQTGRILVTQNQAAHPPTTICRAGKLSSFSWWDKNTKKKLLQHTELLPSHPAHQFRLSSNPGTEHFLLLFAWQAPPEARIQGTPTLTPRPKTTEISNTCHRASCLLSTLSVSVQLWRQNLLVTMRRHVAFIKCQGEGCSLPCCLLRACLD